LKLFKLRDAWDTKSSPINEKDGKMRSYSRLAGNILRAILMGIILFGSLPAGVVLAQSSRMMNVSQSSDDQLSEDEGDASNDTGNSSESDPVVDDSSVGDSQSIEPPVQPDEIDAPVPVVETQESSPVTEQPQEQNPNSNLENEPSLDDVVDDSIEQIVPTETDEPTAPSEEAPPEEDISSIVSVLAEEEILITDMNDQPVALSSETAVEALGSDPWFEEDGVKHGFVKPGESCPTFIDVCHNSDENPFQAAIDSAPEGKSTTIYVAAQNYETDVIINKPQLSLMVGSIHSLFGEDVWSSGEGSAAVNRMTLLYELSGFTGITVLDEVIVANDGVHLQQAVDLIETGGTVTVAPGEYQGFKIKKSGVKINGLNTSSPASGAGGNAPVIRSGLADGNVGIEIDADYVSVEGFVFKENDRAIMICDANHVNISQNTFTNNHWGVYVGGIESQDIQIHNNRFTQNNAAVENAALSSATQINAQQNWWGSNLGPSRLDIVAGESCVGDQCGDWVIGSLDFSNWLKVFPPSTTDTSPVAPVEDALVLNGFTAAVIPVTGGQPVALSCENRCTFLTLPGGEQIELCDLCGQQAEFQTLNQDQLPADLPDGFSFISAVNFNVQPVNGTEKLISDQDIQASLLMNIPAFRSGGEFGILFWDSSLDGGIGGWKELDIAPVLSDQGAIGSDYQSAQVNVQGMGLYVLVAK
jgi:hypothetical protein